MAMQPDEYQVLKQRIIDEVKQKAEKGGLHYNSKQLARHIDTDYGHIVEAIFIMEREGLVSSHNDHHIIFDESILSA